MHSVDANDNAFFARSKDEAERWAADHGFVCVVGVDEVGRGPLAGPVVAAAVALDSSRPIAGLTDSKLLSEARRNHLDGAIRAHARAIGIGVVSVEEIDTLNILRASLEAMRLALAESRAPADCLLVDGCHGVPGISIAQKTFVKGELRSQSIAAASIVAKVFRDRLMVELDAVYPGYGFRIHKGYPTLAHRDALCRLGPSPIHRRSFRGVTSASP